MLIAIPAYGWSVTLLERIEARAARTSGRPLYVDATLAVGFLVVCIVALHTQQLTGELHDPTVRDYVTTAIITLPIAIRRRAPMWALTIACIAIFVHVVTNAPEGATPLAVALLMYSVAAWRPTATALAGLAVVGVTLVGIGVFGDDVGFGAADVAFTFSQFAVLCAAGIAVRARRQSTEARLREATERAELETQRAARSLAEERLRIAQELHDVVAHSISVIAVQAGVGSHFLDSNPAETREALDAIGRTSRGTLNELRRLLGVLRGDDGEPVHAPAPTLAELPGLIEEMRRLGLPVQLEVSGDPSPDHRAVEMSAFRVIQEALTNVIKHAGSTSRVAVEVDHGHDGLRIAVVDDGRGAMVGANGVTLPSGRHGLMGMRERVELWGGSLASGPRPGGGFAVTATFPYGADA